MVNTKQGKELNSVSLKQTLKALTKLGLSDTDAEVYMFLAPKIPQTAKNIAGALRIEKQKLYPCLKNLQQKGIVNCTSIRPKLFSAVPMENVIDLLVKANLEDAQSMEKNRQEILACWQEILKKNNNQ
jgi:sugar-specific transcriptional regulator TrmB